MIRYNLACDAGHRFDSWFRDSETYDAQALSELVVCPCCGSNHVCKAIMAPAVVGARALSAGPTNETVADDRSREMRALLRQIRDRVIAEGHDVGADFAMEARRIHDGLAPARQIYGQASLEEARELVDDGVGVLPLPIVPDELN